MLVPSRMETFRQYRRMVRTAAVETSRVQGTCGGWFERADQELLAEFEQAALALGRRLDEIGLELGRTAQLGQNG